MGPSDLNNLRRRENKQAEARACALPALAHGLLLHFAMKNNTRLFAICTAAATVLGCGGEEPPNTSFTAQAITESCAPNDGPALRLVLSDSINAECGPSSTGESIELLIWAGTIDAPATFDFSGEPLDPGAALYRPVNATEWQAVDSGTIVFDSFDPAGTTSGSFYLQLGRASRRGTFQTTWCEPVTPVLCG